MTYSEAVKDSCSTSSRTVYDQETLKCVVKDVVAEEDISRNLVKLGLADDTTEQITEKVSEVSGCRCACRETKIEAFKIGLKLSFRTVLLNREQCTANLLCN